MDPFNDLNSSLYNPLVSTRNSVINSLMGTLGSGLNSSSGISIPDLGGLDPRFQAIIAMFPDLFDTATGATDVATDNGGATPAPDGGGGRSTARVDASGAYARSGGGTTARSLYGGGGGGGGAGMGGYPNITTANLPPVVARALNRQPREGGFVGMADRLGIDNAARDAVRNARRLERAGGRRGGGGATSNADGGTVRMGNVDPGAHIDIDVSGGREVERAQRVRRERDRRAPRTY